MMLTIQGLAPSTKYAHVKLLIRQKCQIDDFILDNLITDTDGTKKVRIGLTNDHEGLQLIKCLDGYRTPENYIVKVSSFSSKPGAGPPTGGFNAQFQNQQRNDYPNQPTFGSQGATNDYNRQNVMRGPSGPQGPGGPSPWTSNNNDNQWAPNSNVMSQGTSNNFSYGAGGQNNNPGFKQQSGNFRPEMRTNLRSIQTEGLAPSDRFPPNQYQQDKPVTIMKDNFQGPTQFNVNHLMGQTQQSYPQRGTDAPWQQNIQPSNAPPFNKSFDGRTPNRDPKNFQSKPDTYKEYEKSRGFSPSRDAMPRRMSPSRDMHRDPSRREEMNRDLGRREEMAREPPGRREDIRRGPTDRREDMNRDGPGRSDMGPRRSSPGRMDLSQRRMETQRIDSPHGVRGDQGRRYSPTGRRASPPTDRRNIPGGPGPRRDSPPRRMSPSRRLASPTRRDRPGPRYSPGRHHSDKMDDKFGPDSKDLKKIRPAYEPISHAPNQPMYSGGFRPSIHDNAQYNRMKEEQSAHWHRSGEDSRKHEDERRDLRMQIGGERGSNQIDKRYSPVHKSRSPNRRDRSPIRDRRQRPSLSPVSSYSPRRSWALEKRCSPDAPPPPIWPGQNPNRDQARTNFPDKDQKPKHQPVWEPRSYKDVETVNRRPEERSVYDEAKLRVARELAERDSSHRGTGDRYQLKFSPRDVYQERRDDYQRRDLSDRKPHAGDFELPPKHRNEDRRDDYNRRRESLDRDVKLAGSNDFDIGFEDVYKSALEFKRKAEELRKSGSRKRDDFDGDRRPRDKIEDDKYYEDQGRYREEPRGICDDRPRDDRPDNHRSHDNHHTNTGRRMENITTAARQKRDKAIDEIVTKMLDKHQYYKHVEGDQRRYIMDELKTILDKIVYDMFGDADVSFIEIIIKYQAKFNIKDETKMLADVMRTLPKNLRIGKRHVPDASDVPAKIRRVSPSTDMKQGPSSSGRPKLADHGFHVSLPPPATVNLVPATSDVNLPPSSLVNLPPPTLVNLQVPQVHSVLDPSMMPMMFPAPYYQSLDTLQHLQNQTFVPETAPSVELRKEDANVTSSSYAEEPSQDGYQLYLCRDDHERFTSEDADLLKDFIVSEMFKATGTFQGWSPDFTLKGLKSLYKYEVITKDKWSRDWFLKLDFNKFTDFSQFKDFGIVVYTTEELWYERAAIWLPGHSKMRNIEPLDKLRLHNKTRVGVNIDSWKCVKKVVTEKGTRLYVDMPPSSARALESHNMQLSYDLQQVNVFLKVAAVDKAAFDKGLKDTSVTNPKKITDAVQNSPMPTIANDPSLVKMNVKGKNKLSLDDARRIKENIIYRIYTYQQRDGTSRTDFVNYGYLKPNYFAVMPGNEESKRWLLRCNIGKAHRNPIQIIGSEELATTYFKMFTMIRDKRQPNANFFIEKLRQSNQGVKGLHFGLWKGELSYPPLGSKLRLDVEIDLESAESLASMKFRLDYLGTSGIVQVVEFKPNKYTHSEFLKAIKTRRAEMTDTYVVANMELDSDNSDSDSVKNIICLE